MYWHRSSSRAKRRLLTRGTALVALSLLVAACGSSGGSGGNAAASGSGSADNSPTTLKITTLGLCNEIPVFWAQSKGLFAKNHLDVQLVKSTGGAAALSALQSGDIDLAFTNPFSTMIALSQGLKLQWVATAYETPTNQNSATNAVGVAANSPYNDAKSLNGKTIAVNEVGGINQIITSQWMTMEGGDPSTVKFVALPFTQLASAAVSGQVAASQVPQQNVNPSQGLRSLGDPYVVVGQGKPLVFAGYVTTGDKSNSMKTAMQNFQTSLIEADQAINDPANKDEHFQLESQNCKQDVNVLKTIPENPYEARVDTSALQRMGTILKDQKLVTNPEPPKQWVPSYVKTKSS